MDEFASRRAMARADRAKRLLEDELYVEAFDIVRKALIEQWEASPPEKVEYREDLKRALDVAKALRQVLTVAIRDGQVAATDLAQLERQTAQHNKR